MRPATLANRAKRVAELVRKLAKQEAKLAAWDAAVLTVKAMPVPPIVEDRSGASLWLTIDGRMAARCCDGKRTPEREQCAIDGWREDKVRAMCGQWFRPRVDDLRRDLAKARALVAH